MALTRQQESAIKQGGKNIIVSAGAGSGKTSVLTKRVYKHIEQDKWNIDEMLVLTFTKAAASEMKKRIRTNLVNSNKLSRQEQARQINKLDSSYIMTFDAYALFLVKKYHQVLNIDSDVGIIDQNVINIKQNEILDEIMNEEYRDKDNSFINLISDFCIKDDNNIKEALINISDKLNMIYKKQEYIEAYEDNFYSAEALNNFVSQYTVLINKKIKQLNKYVDKFSNYVEDYRLYFDGIDRIRENDNYAILKDNVDACVSTTKRLPNGSEDEAKTLKRTIGEYLKDLQSMLETGEEEIKEELLNTRNNALYLLKLANNLNERLYAYKKENNLYEYSDIFKMAIDLVYKNNEIKNELKASFKEILVDEYQDTNDLQEEFINNIENGNVYMVGDIKQSIYRFRNANPALFMNKYENYKNNRGGIALDLTSNFRSRKEVLNNINLIFERLMSKDFGGADYIDGQQMDAGNLEYEEEGKGKTKQDNNIELLTYTYDKDTRKSYPFNLVSKEVMEAFVVAKDIKDKVDKGYLVSCYKQELDDRGNVSGVLSTRPAKYSDFAILMDRGTEFDTYKQVLTYFNIPTAIEQEEKMTDSDLMTVIKNCYKLICCVSTDNYGYEFKYSFASVGRSFLMEMGDSELYDVVTKNKYHETDLYKKINSIVVNIESKTNGNILDELIDSFDIYSKINKIGEVKENLIKIDYIYRLAELLNSMGYTYLKFSDYLNNVFLDEDGNISFNVQNENENAVRITTIHKAKGLEYNICYYPNLSKQFNKKDLKEKIVFSKQLGIIIPSMVENRGLKNTIVKDIYTYDYNVQDMSEKIRLFYVALTRAKEKMILICPLEDKTQDVISEDIMLSAKSFKDILDIIHADISAYVKDINYDDYKFSSDYLIKNKDIFKHISKEGRQIVVREGKHVVPRLIEESAFSKKVKLIEDRQIELMEQGTRIHYCLQTLDFNNPNYELIDDELIDKIKSFMDSDLMTNSNDAIAHKEYEFIYQEDKIKKHGFIDLLLEYADHFDIIDYKLKNISDENYDVQLNGYRKYLQSISNKKVNCYLYSIIEGNYREVKE